MTDFRFTDAEWTRIRGALARGSDKAAEAARRIERRYAEAQGYVARALVKDGKPADRMELRNDDVHRGMWLRWARFYRGGALVGVAGMTMCPLTYRVEFFHVAAPDGLPADFKPWDA